MNNVYIYCEGQTEETLIKNILYPYFINMEIIVIPIICTTKRTVVKKFKGGVKNYSKIKTELTRICRSHKNEYVTTMFDYYAMPDDTPCIKSDIHNIYERINTIENAINNDIGESNCIFNFCVHEFEGLLFSNPESFNIIADSDVVNKIQIIKNAFLTPEHINNSHQTSPSKRIEAIIPKYAKIINGYLLAEDMGIDAIMSQCRHFNEWIHKIATLNC